jgi:hypothetical protein
MTQIANNNLTGLVTLRLYQSNLGYTYSRMHMEYSARCPCRQISAGERVPPTRSVRQHLFLINDPSSIPLIPCRVQPPYDVLTPPGRLTRAIATVFIQITPSNYASTS